MKLWLTWRLQSCRYALSPFHNTFSPRIIVSLSKAFCWDWMMSIPEEIKMCRKGKISAAIIAYFVSRCDSRFPYVYRNPVLSSF